MAAPGQNAVIALEAFQVAFLLLHDWVPLGRPNNVQAVQSVDPRRKLALVTVLSALPYVLGLTFSVGYAHDPRWPHWVRIYLWISYGLLLYGQLQAWWIPYLWRPDPARARRYEGMFANTHTFLPVRNGIAPNTLHIVLHLATLATLLLLFWA